MDIKRFGLICVIFILNGCAAGTRNIELNSPSYSNEVSASGNIIIGNIQDKRVFEAAPKSPSTPSVDGDLAKTSKETLSTLIGRQRNGYGMAMGDIVLPNGDTVQEVTRKLLTTALESRGYNVVDNKTDAYNLTVDVNKFWAWFSPGMFSVSFEADIQCTVHFDNGTTKRSLDVSGYGVNKGQVASNANWQLAYERAFQDLLKNLDKILDSEGL